MKQKTSFLVTVQYFLVAYGQYLDVTINQGTVRGYKHSTHDFYTFYGIPYATAPSGRDKFKAPGPAPNWNNTLEATNSLILCPQNIIIVPVGREDCLVVNVFVPESNTTSKSVLVYIHGGGFSTGSGNIGVPLTLVNKDIVVVSLNYRVGAHGFLCLNTENVPGNAGLKDQIAGLEWVKLNIQAFGGNPDDVTIFGSSAGAASVELLMLSPAADGLFQKVISDGGSAITTWAVNPHSQEYAKTIASLNGATNVDDISELENYYLDLSYTQLSRLPNPSFHAVGFTPCIENGHNDDKAVITALPKEVLQSGNYTKIPLLAGYSSAEGLLLYLQRGEIMNLMNQNFGDVLPPHLSDHALMNTPDAIRVLRSFYFNDDNINDGVIRNFTDYFTDSYFSYWIVESAKLHALHSSVYLYEFIYAPSTQFFRPDLGAAHCAPSDLISNLAARNFSENDIIVQRRLIDVWANFVKFGQPVEQSEPDYWEALDAERVNYLEFDVTVQNKNLPLPERMEVWNQIVHEEAAEDAANSISLCLGLLMINFIIMFR